MASNRDDFRASDVRKLAERVNYRCSHPECRKPTLGPSCDPGKSINLGKAAHITAAAKGGPRYDPTLTPLERRSIQNGIWLCGVHADLIDKDAAAYPVMRLHDWKDQAERQAAHEAFTNQGGRIPKVVFELSEEDREFLRTLALPPEDTTDSILARVSGAVRSDIQAFVDAQESAAHAIPLHLTLWDGTEAFPTDLAGLARGISVLHAVALVAPPGTGKTTTLIQLAETILEAGDKVAVYVPLAEWEGARESWFETLTHRNAFRSFKPQHFMQLAYEGRLVLLLDGWNELSPEASIRAHKQLSALQRDFSQLGVVIGTRQQAHPVEGQIVRVEPLSEDQQLELAGKLRAAEGERLVDQAWRTPGLHELITIPLYLKALLLGVPGDALPDTKDAVLSSFVRQHESTPEKAVLLRTRLQDLHPEILSDLASTATTFGTTALTEEQARRAVTDAVRRLQASGQLTTPLQPATVIDTLVDSHLLVRTVAAGNVSFQHQQFQEWYASFRVERLILAAAGADADARQMLRETVLDRPSWEESVLFACERLSRRDRQGTTAVATVVIDTLGIDPMLAAEMIQRSSPGVWGEARDQVMRFVCQWHKPGHIDRAVKFMVTTGQPEFASRIWPFLEHADDQVYRRVVRLANPFPPSALGPDAAHRLAALPDAQRGDLVAELAHQGGYSGMDLVASVAKAERNPQVVLEALEALEFRGAMRHVTDILGQADDSVWQEMAKRGVIRDLVDPAQRSRLAGLRRAILESESDPIRQAHSLLRSGVDRASAEGRLLQVLTSDAVPATDEGRSLFRSVHNRFPPLAAAALVTRLQAGQAVPIGVEDILDEAPAIDAGPIAEAALKPGSSSPTSRAAHRLIGPVTVGKLIDAYASLGARLKGQPYDQPSSDEYHAYRDAIRDSRQESFLQAIVARADAKDVHTVTTLANLLHLHGRHVDHAPMRLAPEDRGRLISILLRWSDVLLAAPDATRHDLVRVVQAMQRVPTPDFVPVIAKMLQRDIDETNEEKEQLRISRRGGAYTSWSIQYHVTLAAIGDDQASALARSHLADLYFGNEAAHVLLDLWNRDHPSEKEGRLHVWHDYSGIRARRDRLDADPAVSSESAEAMWDVVRQHGTPSEPPEKQRHAVKLACVAMRMPLGVNRPELQELFKLPLPYASKQDLFVVAAMSGIVLSAGMLIDAVGELLRDAKTQSWRLDENRGEAMTWIELFAFSDQPLAVLGSLDLLPPDHRAPYRLRRLLGALGHSPHPHALEVLKALAHRDPRIVEDDDWVESLVRLGSVDAARTLLDSLCDGALGSRQRQSRHQFSDRLAAFARTHPSFKAELLARYADAGACKAHEILEEALLELAEPDAILAVIHGMASRGAGFAYPLARALRELAISQTPSARWANTVELIGIPLTAFRKRLFALTADETLGPLARRCLEEIDELRDEYGRVSDEPRHPDITSRRPWPIVAQDT